MTNVTLKSNDPIEAEAVRLLRSLIHVECQPGRKWNIETCREIAPLTLEINQLKQEKNAIVLTHSYVELAPRDIVSRAIHQEMVNSGDACVYLDLTALRPDFIRDRLPEPQPWKSPSREADLTLIQQDLDLVQQTM